MERVALGMLARSDRAAEPLLDRVLGIVAGSFDGVEIQYDEGRRIDDFSAARNRVIDRARDAGYDWLFMLDSDEAMFPDDIAKVRSLMTPDRSLIVLPRHEFVCDFAHHDPTGWPDYQARVFRLRSGYRYRRRVHEGLFRGLWPLSEMRLGHGFRSDDTPIYHYGRLIGSASMELKMLNYDRLARGEAPLDRLPDGMAVRPDEGFWAACVPFAGAHPLQDAS